MTILKQVIFATAPLLNMLVLGMMFGYPALLTPALLDPGSGDIHTDKHVATWIASLPGLSGLVAVFAIAPLMHYYGRRLAHLAITVPVLCGWILTFFAPNIQTLIIARSLQGLSNGGVYFHAICIAELTNPKLRGLMLNFKVLAVSLGIFVIHIFGYYLHWRYLALVCVVPVSISLIICFFWPDSPEWLVSRHRYEEAEQVFLSLRGSDVESLREIKKMIVTEKARVDAGILNSNVKEILKKIRSKVLWRPVILLACAIAIPEVGGRHFFPAYALQLSEQIAGDKTMSFILTYILDGISFLGAIVSIPLIKLFSRRKQIIFSGVVIVLLILAFSLVMFLKVKFFKESIFLKWTTIVILCLFFLVAYSSTYAASYVLMGELFPLEYRSLGSFLNGIFSSVILTVMLKLVPILNDAFDIHGMFLILSVCMLLSLLYMHYDLPETRNRTLHDIADYFRGYGTKYASDSKRYESEGLNQI